MRVFIFPDHRAVSGGIDVRQLAVDSCEDAEPSFFSLQQSYDHWNSCVGDERVNLLTSSVLRDFILDPDVEFVWLLQRDDSMKWMSQFPHGQWVLGANGVMHPLITHHKRDWFQSASEAKVCEAYFRPHEVGERGLAFGPTCPLGFRLNDDVCSKPDKDREVSVAVIGGSALFGSYLYNNETIASQLEAMLNGGLSADNKKFHFTVRNFGYPRSGVLENMVRFVTYRSVSEFDVVVLLHGFDDIYSNRYSDRYLVEEKSILHKQDYLAWAERFLQQHIDSIPAKRVSALPHLADIAQAYIRRLQQFISIFRSHGVDVLSLREPWTADHDLISLCAPGGDDESLLKSVGRTLDVARLGEVQDPALIGQIELSEFFDSDSNAVSESFYDARHLKPTGARNIAKVAAEHVAHFYSDASNVSKLEKRLSLRGKGNFSFQQPTAPGHAIAAPGDGDFAQQSRTSIDALVSAYTKKAG